MVQISALTGPLERRANLEFDGARLRWVGAEAPFEVNQVATLLLAERDVFVAQLSQLLWELLEGYDEIRTPAHLQPTNIVYLFVYVGGEVFKLINGKLRPQNAAAIKVSNLDRLVDLFRAI